MTVKRYTPTQCCEHDGTYVTYYDYQKLVAENARLIALAKGWASAVDDSYFEQHGDIYTDSIEACNEELSIISTNTDAAIAEIKAQGVDELAEAWEAIKLGEGVSMSESTALKYKQRAQDAREFAANLRAGSKE